MRTRQKKAAIARHLPGAVRSAENGPGRTHPRADQRVGAYRAMREALAEVIASCGRYATAYATARHAPIGCDVMLGPILLDVLHGLAALGADGEIGDRVSEIISLHALDLEE